MLWWTNTTPQWCDNIRALASHKKYCMHCCIACTCWNFQGVILSLWNSIKKYVACQFFSPNVFNQTFNKTVVFWRSVTWYCFYCIPRVACVFLTNNVDPSLTAYVSAKPFTWSWNRISGQNTWNRSEIPFRFANRLLTKVIDFLLCLKISWKIIH